MPITTSNHDAGLNTPLELHGRTLFVVGAGHRVNFIVIRTEVTPQRQHELSYLLTQRARDGERPVGFGNAHRLESVADRERAGGAKAIIGTGFEL